MANPPSEMRRAEKESIGHQRERQDHRDRSCRYLTAAIRNQRSERGARGERADRPGPRHGLLMLADEAEWDARRVSDGHDRSATGEKHRHDQQRYGDHQNESEAPEVVAPPENA